MKIQYIQHNQINKQKWDICIAKSFNGLIYAYSFYLDIVSPQWNALVLNDYEAVMPLTWRKKYGIKYLYQPFFAPQYGVFGTNVLKPEIINLFLRHIPKEYKLIEIALNIFNKADEPTFKLIKSQTFELDLIHEYSVIHKNYSTKFRRHIKKAESNGITCTKNNNPQPIIEMFRENRGKNVSNYKDKDYKQLLRLIYELISKSHAEIWCAFTKENQLCAGAIFIGSHNRAYFMFSALSEEGKKASAMPAIIDSFIKNNSTLNITLEFSTNNVDIARFYKSIGTQLNYFNYAMRNRLPFPLNLLKK